MSKQFAPELIIFDCDGTLVNSEYLYNKVISDMLLEQGLKDYDVHYCLEMFTGLTLSNIRYLVEDKHQIDLSNILTSELYVGRAQAQMDLGVDAIDGARELLKYCSASTKICMGSNGERSSVIKSLKITGLYDFFGGHDRHIFTKIQVANAKPAPDLFLFAAENMGVSPENCLVVEDSVAGVTAGKSAGMQVFGFTGAGHDPQNLAIKLKQAGASESFSSLIHIIDALNGEKEYLQAC